MGFVKMGGAIDHLPLHEHHVAGLLTLGHVRLSDISPLENGTASPGTHDGFVSSSDHVHPSDSVKADLDSPGFTGIPTTPTASLDTRTEQLANTAFVYNCIGADLQISAVTYTIEMNELSSTINSIPKWLDRNYTIRVRPGTITSSMGIGHFRGPGTLTIRTVNESDTISESIGQQTHRLTQINISNCMNPQITVRGFCTTNTVQNSVFVTMCTAFIDMHFITSVSGVPTQSNLRGINIRNCRMVYVSSVDIANKNTAIQVELATVLTGNIDGVTLGNNQIGIYAANGANVQCDDMSVPRATTPRAQEFGGRITGPSQEQQLIRPWSDNTTDIGASNLRIRQIYAATATINTSDRNEKENIKPLQEDLSKDFIMGLKPVSYKFIDGKRKHYGLIAQDVETLMEELQIDSSDFAGFIKNNERYGLRYEEFIAPLIKVVQEQQKEIEALIKVVQEQQKD